MYPRDKTQGLTLIELVAAMALFALVAVMGLQALSATLRMRDRLTGIERETAGIGLAVALLRHDLSAMVPLLFYPPDGGVRSSLNLSADGRTLSFSIGGQPDLPPVRGRGLHRVEWRLDPAGQQLLRRIWPVLYPASGRSAQPEVTYLSGVRRMAVRSYWPKTGWAQGVDNGQPREAPDPGGGDGDGSLAVVAQNYSDTLPEAVELTLEIGTFGTIVLVESLR